MIATILKDKATPGSALLAIALAEYGTACFDWEPEVLRAELADDFGVSISDIKSDKLQAAIIVYTTDQFESNWHVFNTVTHCLNGEPTDADVLDPIDPEQVASAMAEVEVLRSQLTDGGLKFDDEVNTYAGLLFSSYGLLFTPTIFPTAIMPNLQGEHSADTQSEKQEALNEIYSLKKAQVTEYLEKVKNCYKR